jgi:NADPH-dependent glutamate synthase beta subunit-like oxidoreductase
MMGKGNNLSHVEISSASEWADDVTEPSRELIPVDTLLTGAGRFPELIYVPRFESPEEETPATDSWETLVPSPSPFAEEDMGIFRPGEVTSDYKAVVEAIGAGRRGASSIQRYLVGEAVEAPEHMIRKHTRVLSVDQVEPVSEAPRETMPERPEDEQIEDPNAEIALGYSEEEAKREAKRCLQCGLICYRRVAGPMH